MSRIGKLPIAIPDKVEVAIEGTHVTVKGPKGTLDKHFEPVVQIVKDGGEIRVSPGDESRHANAMYGTVRSIINGMVLGVAEGYSKKLEIHGVGFRAAVKGKVIDLNLGYSHNIEHPIPEGITVNVPDNTHIEISGADKQVVGDTAARIRSYYPAEPYKGKGVRYQGERVRRKEGKKAK